MDGHAAPARYRKASGMTVSPDMDRIADRMEIASLSDRFGRALDTNDLAMFLSIFAEDVDYRSGGRHLPGTAALEQFFTQRTAGGRVSRHFYSGLIVTFDGEDSATASSNWITFGGAGPLPLTGTEPFMVADVHDSYRRIGGRWLITKREIVPVFRNENAAPPVPAAGAKS